MHRHWTRATGRGISRELVQRAAYEICRIPRRIFLQSLTGTRGVERDVSLRRIVQNQFLRKRAAYVASLAL